MLDACPHHHEETESPTVNENAEAAALDGLSLRSPGKSKGKRFWRSLDELSKTPEFEQMLHREFPHAASEWKDDASRRHFLKLMGASLALGGLAACTMRKTDEKIMPYVVPPEEVIPGRPLFFASSMTWNGYGKGVVVESHEGRPTKIEGNVDHPASLGATDIWQQASVLDLYDPDRSQAVCNGSSDSTWGKFLEAVGEEMKALRANKGAGLRFLTGTVTSPTIARQINAVIAAMPEAKWHQYEPVGRQNARDGANLAFGQDVQTVYKFENASVILSLDCNFLSEDPGSVVYARKFIDGRRIRQGGPAQMNRLYAVESTVTQVGAMSDHRLPLKTGQIAAFTHDLAGALSGTDATGANAKWISAVARDLLANKGKSLVLVGESQPKEVHALVHAINDMLGSVGNTLVYTDPVEASGPGGPLSLEDLTNDINGGNVTMLVMLGGINPSFTAPTELGYWAGGMGGSESKKEFLAKNPLSKVKTVVHHGMYGPLWNETALFNTWHIPASHYLECWGDVRAFDGTVSIIQPLIYPLYASKSEVELLGGLVGEWELSGQDQVRTTWKKELAAPFENSWQIALEKGVIAGTAFKPKQVALKTNLASAMAAVNLASSAGGLEIIFKPDPMLWDGRYANNGWLQEVPKPLTLLTWDNAALMSLNTANKLGIVEDDPGRTTGTQMVELKYQDRTVKIPALILPGHVDDSITVYLGGGRGRAGRVGTGVGQNVYLLRPGTTWFASGLEVTLTDDSYALATTQSHHLIDKSLPADRFTNVEERDLYKVFTLDDLQQQSGGKGTKTISLPILPELTPERKAEEKSELLNPPWEYNPKPGDHTYNKWGMVIDNNACIGCNACVVACQSENNSPVVGKDQVLRSREMHWLRIDTYFDGDPGANPHQYFQPIPCMQCENAPCELVCPVEATSHSAEGINEQTYNRCVGTRYCSNNCPYKVRRFNFLYYSNYDDATLMLQKNPNVTVRSRGIMEKCNYCIQRVNNGRIEAKKQDRPIAPGEVVTACAQACPTQAILFGNLNDPAWEITKLLDEETSAVNEGKTALHYSLLEELNTKPRTTYMARVRNPNPELA
jgi:MoCo/4Fe-4S cofactor protein with predicted Tat translocation signal